MITRRTFGVLALAVAIAGFTGCDDITGSDDGTIIVRNNASVSVREMYIAQCEASTWGSDRLGSSETIAPGRDRRFDVDAGCYDLRAEFIDATFAEDFGIPIDEGDQFTWELVD